MSSADSTSTHAPRGGRMLGPGSCPTDRRGRRALVAVARYGLRESSVRQDARDSGGEGTHRSGERPGRDGHGPAARKARHELLVQAHRRASGLRLPPWAAPLRRRVAECTVPSALADWGRTPGRWPRSVPRQVTHGGPDERRQGSGSGPAPADLIALDNARLTGAIAKRTSNSAGSIGAGQGVGVGGRVYVGCRPGRRSRRRSSACGIRQAIRSPIFAGAVGPPSPTGMLRLARGVRFRRGHP